VSLPAQRPSVQRGEPGLGDRHRLYPDGAEIHVLAVIMDWHSRCVLSWRLSNILEADFCVDALEGALSMDVPRIFNTDQGNQFTSEAFTSVLLNRGVQISMDSAGGYMDNVFVERLRRSVKHEEVCLKAYESVVEARAGIGAYPELLQ